MLSLWTDEDSKDDGDGKVVVVVRLPDEVASPTPSDLLCESLTCGYLEDEVAACMDTVISVGELARNGLGSRDHVEILRRIMHRRMMASAICPWHGPLPKVSHPAITLLDFCEAGSWKVVSRRRKKAVGASVVARPLEAKAFCVAERALCLNALDASVGPAAQDAGLGFGPDGRMA